MLKNFLFLLYFAILTTTVVASWIGFSIYHNFSSSTISVDTGIRITPIPSNFDKKTIDSLKERKQINVDLEEEVILPSITPEPSTASRSSILETIPTGAQQSTFSGQIQTPGL